MRGAQGYALRRITQIPVAFLIISVLVFGLIHLTPGDPVELALPPRSSPELIESIRKQFGLDRPLYIQYCDWLAKMVQGDLGKSIQTGESVRTMIAVRLPVTFTLATTATVISVIVALFGVIAAVRWHSRTDYVVLLLSTLGMSVPNFFTGMVLILMFGLVFRILPISGFVNPFSDPVKGLRHIILPAISLGLIYAALHIRMVRSSMLEVLKQDYVRTAHAKGLSKRVIILRHALKNAMLPIITVVAMNYAYMLGGSIVIEQVFALPGIGRLLIDAVNTRDFPVIQGILMIAAVIFLIINLLADLCYGIIDPRIKY